MTAFCETNDVESGTELDLKKVEANLSFISLNESDILKTIKEKSKKMVEQIFERNYASTKVLILKNFFFNYFRFKPYWII